MALKVDNRETVRLDRWEAKLEQLIQARKDIKAMQAFADGLEAELQRNMKDAEVAKVNGVEVIVWSPIDDYAWGQFRDANPEIYQQFMRPATTQVLDKEALKAAHPGLLKPFQKRPFRLV